MYVVVNRSFSPSEVLVMFTCHLLGFDDIFMLFIQAYQILPMGLRKAHSVQLWHMYMGLSSEEISFSTLKKRGLLNPP